MSLILWLVIAWIGGIGAILGSLMVLASLLLWWVENEIEAAVWPRRFKLLGFSLAIALLGFLLLAAVPFPFAGSQAGY